MVEATALKWRAAAVTTLAALALGATAQVSYAAESVPSGAAAVQATGPSPSSDGVAHDLPEREIKDDYPVAALAKARKLTGAQIDEIIRQCGYFAVWRVTDRSGLTPDERSLKEDYLHKVEGAKQKSGSAAVIDDYYGELGAPVDDVPAVGAIATWEANAEVRVGRNVFTVPGSGHAAYVSRVYQIAEKDVAAATALSGPGSMDYAKLAKLLENAKTSKGTKVPFVLLEDYNSFGGEHQYGVAMLPASAVGHFVHVAKSKAMVKLTPAERIKLLLKNTPAVGDHFGAPIGEPRVNGNEITQDAEKGTFVYNTATGSVTEAPLTPEATIKKVIAQNPSLVTDFGKPVGAPKVVGDKIVQELERGMFTLDTTTGQGSAVGHAPVAAPKQATPEEIAQLERVRQKLAAIVKKYEGKQQNEVVSRAIAAMQAQLARFEATYQPVS